MSYPMQIGPQHGPLLLQHRVQRQLQAATLFRRLPRRRKGRRRDGFRRLFESRREDDRRAADSLHERIRAKLPSTPLIFVQTIYRESGNFDLRSRKIEEDKRDMARRQMAEAMKRFDNVYFVDKADLTGTDHVTSADGTHPSDLGYWRWAQNLQPELLKVFRKCGIR